MTMLTTNSIGKCLILVVLLPFSHQQGMPDGGAGGGPGSGAGSETDGQTNDAGNNAKNATVNLATDIANAFVPQKPPAACFSKPELEMRSLLTECRCKVFRDGESTLQLAPLYKATAGKTGADACKNPDPTQKTGLYFIGFLDVKLCYWKTLNIIGDSGMNYDSFTSMLKKFTMDDTQKSNLTDAIGKCKDEASGDPDDLVYLSMFLPSPALAMPFTLISGLPPLSDAIGNLKKAIKPEVIMGMKCIAGKLADLCGEFSLVGLSFDPTKLLKDTVSTGNY